MISTSEVTYSSASLRVSSLRLCELVEQLASIHKCPPSTAGEVRGASLHEAARRCRDLAQDFSGFFDGRTSPRGVRPVYGAGVPVIAIDDPDDPRLSDYVRLSDPHLRRRVEAERGFFIAESPLVVRALMRSGRRVRSVLVTPAQHEALADVARPAVDAPVYVAADEVLRRVVGFDLHRGAVASGDRWPLPARSTRCSRGARRVAVLQRLNDHENLGGVFRNAAAFGIDAVLLDAECADPLYRRCVRVSIGHVLTVPWTRLASLDELRGAGFTLFALTPAPDAAPSTRSTGPSASRCCSEPRDRDCPTSGSPRPTSGSASRCSRVADSLNVATAAAIAFYASALIGRSTTSPSTSSMRRVERDRVEQRAVVGDEEQRCPRSCRAPARAARWPAGRGGWSARRARDS